MATEVSARELETTLETIRQSVLEDGNRAPEEWKPVFEVMRKRIFDPDFKLGEARLAIGLLKATDKKAFEACFGCSPLTYLRQRRLEAADAVLALGELRVWWVARQTGFRSAQALWRASRRQEKLRIGKEHKKASSSLKRRPPKARNDNDPAAILRQLLGGGADSTVTLAHQEQLQARSISDDLSEWERHWAVLYWTVMRQLPWSVQEDQVKVAPFETPALFEHLCEQSREEGRDDRAWGVKVAELALVALGPLAKHAVEPTLSHWQGKAWACVGNARCLALDYEGAQAAFETAQRFLSIGEAPIELRAQLHYYRSCLRWFQRRLGEALELAEAALELLEERRGKLAAQVLMARAQVYSQLAQAERALPDLQAALAALEGISEPFLSWVIHQNLASTLWRLGRLDEAERWLEHARPLAARLGKLAPWCHTLWLEGLLAARQGSLERAAARLREVCQGLLGIGERREFAIAALDLARVEAGRGEVGEAMRWAGEALPHLELLKLESEGLAALGLLRQEMATKQLSAAVLERLRRAAGRAVNAPSLQENVELQPLGTNSGPKPS